jgi:hypothetical protein
VGKEIEFWAANMLLNFQGGQPRVSLDELLKGASGGIGSVLYDWIGSDLDGFIEPIESCETYGETPSLVTAIQAKYPAAADAILFGNALRVLQNG